MLELGSEAVGAMAPKQSRHEGGADLALRQQLAEMKKVSRRSNVPRIFPALKFPRRSNVSPDFFRHGLGPPNRLISVAAAAEGGAVLTARRVVAVAVPYRAVAVDHLGGLAVVPQRLLPARRADVALVGQRTLDRYLALPPLAVLHTHAPPGHAVVRGAAPGRQQAAAQGRQRALSVLLHACVLAVAALARGLGWVRGASYQAGAV